MLHHGPYHGRLQRNRKGMSMLDCHCAQCTGAVLDVAKLLHRGPHLQAVVGRPPCAVDWYVQHDGPPAALVVRPHRLPAVKHQLVHLQQRVGGAVCRTRICIRLAASCRCRWPLSVRHSAPWAGSCLRPSIGAASSGCFGGLSSLWLVLKRLCGCDWGDLQLGRHQPPKRPAVLEQDGLHAATCRG